MDPSDSIGWRRLKTIFRQIPGYSPVTLEKLGYPTPKILISG